VPDDEMHHKIRGIAVGIPTGYPMVDREARSSSEHGSAESAAQAGSTGAFVDHGAIAPNRPTTCRQVALKRVRHGGSLPSNGAHGGPGLR
jgi:hypothetical protein